jgi:type VI secretion system secreted protein Hcp
MKKSLARALAGIAASFAVALPCLAQVSVVGCLYDGTPPNINDDPNRCAPDRKLDIVSIKTSWTNPGSLGTGSGGGAGKVQVGPFVISKNFDRTSPGLFRDIVTGRHLNGAVIVVFETDARGRSRRLLSFLLDTVFVSSLEFDAADSRVRGATPGDLVGLAYEKLTIRDDVSNTVQSFDFATNKGL